MAPITTNGYENVIMANEPIDQSRRQFFRRAVSKTSEVVVKKIDKNVNKRASNYIRPPYALSEMDFLLTCTRCNACIEACEPNCLFPLSSNLGMDVSATPALDLINRSCLLCDGFPCVSACEPKALSMNIDSDNEGSNDGIETEQRPLKIANVYVLPAECLPFQGPECGVCVDLCPIDQALTLQDNKPIINQNLCVGCAQCRSICIVDPKAISIKSVYANADDLSL